MPWWNRQDREADKSAIPDSLRNVRLDLPGWTEATPEKGMRVWWDAFGSALMLAGADASALFELRTDAAELQRKARAVAESQSAGLIEVSSSGSAHGDLVRLIYKRLNRPACVFTGMALLPARSHVWTVIAGERGVSGIREAVITGELIDSGRMTVEGYQRDWARDPYDPDYQGVERSVLRFMSDDESYDARFPDHPLSRVREVLRSLPGAVRVEP